MGFPWGGAASANTNVQTPHDDRVVFCRRNLGVQAEIKAKLTGEVRVNFKSDYFPMEKLASPGMIASIQGNATPFDPNIKPNPQAGGGSTAAVPERT